jgi:hypothetical protein
LERNLGSRPKKCAKSCQMQSSFPCIETTFKNVGSRKVPISMGAYSDQKKSQGPQTRQRNTEERRMNGRASNGRASNRRASNGRASNRRTSGSARRTIGTHTEEHQVTRLFQRRSDATRRSSARLCSVGGRKLAGW